MTRIIAKPGPHDCFIDAGALKVGQAHNSHINTGTTVILPTKPVAMAADVRGGGPGTRETEALNADCLVDGFHGLVLSGGSVFGLAAADRVAERLSADGIGIDVGPRMVPVVPSAILFDLKNDGDKNWGDTHPYRTLADKAYDSATSAPLTQGRAGAGYGATAGAQQGGLGSASLMTDDGIIVSAMVAVNSFGSVINETNPPTPGDVHFPKMGIPGTNTTLAVVATNLNLDKAGCRRLSIMAQDGLARRIHPLHTPYDGDTVFAIATAELNDYNIDPTTIAIAGTLASDCLNLAVGRAIEAAKA